MFKKSTLLIFSLALFTLAFTTSSAQTEQGNMGMSAGVGAPSGVVPIAGFTGGTSGQINIGYSAGTSILFMVSENIQLEAGLGFVSVSTSIDNGGEDPDALSTISVAVGGKYFFRTKSVVSPYLGAGFSFTSLPTIEAGEDMTGSSMNFIAFYGLQGFINKARSVALFIQIGFGYSSTTHDYSGPERTNSTLNFGGSAIGGCIYL